MHIHRIIKLTIPITFCFVLIVLFSGCARNQSITNKYTARLTTSTIKEPAIKNVSPVIISSNTGTKGIWKPKLDTSWQVQFIGTIDLSVDVGVFDLDLFDTSKQTIKDLHAKNKKVFCYINVGAYEEWRSDKNLFPSSILGNDYAGWPGEKWLDIRKLDIIGPIMEKRLDLCKQKGFDGVEPDNINGYTNKTGFALTYQDQLKYNIWLANEAHKRNLSIGLKNNEEQIKDLLLYYDWALVEDCYADKFCDQFKPFIQANKPVFQVEYTDNGLNFKKLCSDAKKLGFSTILKNRKLDAWLNKCD